jgi:hypothetical protein
MLELKEILLTVFSRTVNFPGAPKGTAIRKAEKQKNNMVVTGTVVFFVTECCFYFREQQEPEWAPSYRASLAWSSPSFSASTSTGS